MKFEPGKIYFTRSICDHETIIKLKIAKRTAKTITATSCDNTNWQSKGKTYRIYSVPYDPDERVNPWGKYSMSPTISADRELI